MKIMVGQMKLNLNNINKDILKIIIRKQQDIGDYNPARFSRFYDEVYEEYLRTETNWYN